MTTCRICNKPLTDPKSIAVEMGPDCAEKLQRFVSSGAVDANEMARLEESGNPLIERQMRLTRRAIADGRFDRARLFLSVAMQLQTSYSPVAVGA